MLDAQSRKLTTLPLFQNLEMQDFLFLREALQFQISQAKEHLMRLGQSNKDVLVLLEGTVRVYIPRDGEINMILGILGPGEVLGEMSAVDGSPASASVQALEHCQVLVLRGDMFTDSLRHVPQLGLNMLRLQSRRMRRLTDHTEALATLALDSRLARQLLLFAQDYGVVREAPKLSPEPAITIPLRLTQCDLASLCGSSIKQVNRSMAYYLSQRILDIETGYRITINSQEKLQQHWKTGR